MLVTGCVATFSKIAASSRGDPCCIGAFVYLALSLTHREGYYGYWVFDQVGGLDIGYLTAIDPGYWTFHDLDLWGSDIVSELQ